MGISSIHLSDVVVQRSWLGIVTSEPAAAVTLTAEILLEVQTSTLESSMPCLCQRDLHDCWCTWTVAEY